MTATVSTAEPCQDRTTGRIPIGLVARKRRESRVAIRWVALFAVALMILEGVPQFAAGAAPADHRLQVLSLTVANSTAYTTNFTTGQSVDFSGIITGGGVGGNDTTLFNRGGYHLYWFFGQANSSGNLSVTQQWLSIPSGCSGGSVFCSAWSHFNETTKYGRPGTYNVSVEVDDAWSDFVIEERTIQVNVPQFNVTISSVEPSKGVRAGDAAVFNATAWLPGWTFDPDSTYTWNMGNGAIEYGRQITYYYKTRGQYFVYVTAKDLYTGWSARAYVTYNVSNQAPYFQSASVPTTGVVWDPLAMTAVASDNDGFMIPSLVIWWNFSDGTYATSGNVPGSIWYSCPGGEGSNGPACVSVEANMSHVFTKVGYYHVNITVADTNGLETNYCPSTGCVIHIVSPSAYVHPKNVYGTVGQVLFLNATQALLDTPQERNVSGSALENFTWNSTQFGQTWGKVGRLSSFYPVAGSAKLAVNNAENSGWTNQGTSANVTVNDTDPTFGINKVYTLETISLWNPSWAEPVWFNLTGNAGVVSEGYGRTFTVSNYQQEIFDDVYAQPYYSGGGQALYTGYLNISFGGGGTTVSTPFNLGCAVHYCLNGPLISLNQIAYDQPLFVHGVAFSPSTTGLNISNCFATSCPGHLPQTDCAAPSYGPSMCYLGLVVTNPSSADYTAYACDQHGLCGYDNLTVTESSTYGVSVGDTAPQISLNLTGVNQSGYDHGPYVVASQHLGLGLNDTYYGISQTVLWNWGDGSPDGSSGGCNSAGVCLATVSTVHPYYYQGRYVLAVYAKSGDGSVTANWTFVSVVAPHPVANFTVHGTSLTTGATIRFDGTNSSEGLEGAASLAFTWQFGDGGGWSGNYSSAAGVNHIYEVGKTYYVRLTVENPEGGNATIVKTISLAYQTVSIQVPKVLTTIDAFTTNWANVTSGPLSNYPLMNVSWNYADGQLMSKDYGLDPGHAYVSLWSAPHHWWINVTATTVFGRVVHASNNWTTVTTAVDIDTPELGDTLYGASQNGEFWVQTMGPRLDHTHAFSLTYQWTWGPRGSAASSLTTTSQLVSAYHVFNMTGTATLTVTANNSGILSWTNLTFSVVQVSDGDGLPNLFAAAILHVSPFTPITGGQLYQAQGIGPTNFDLRYLGAIGNPNQDLTGDGLTTMQAIMGSVTGYPSNPLDANPSGDGIPQGSEFFTSSYPANQTGVFNSNIEGGVSADPINGVGYSGSQLAFNQSRIVVELNETQSGSSVTGEVSLGLLTADGRNISLGTPTGVTSTYYLLNASPTMGQVSQYGLTVSDFTPTGNWTLWAKTTSGGVIGTIPSATIFVSYYLNPNLADPYKQGMLQGHSISTPIFNCSAPLNETFPVYNTTTATITNVSFWPYTETYYKLSVMQGVPYTTTTNASLWQDNLNGTGSCDRTGVDQGTPSPTYHGPENSSTHPALANYLGDADFGISPTDVHAAGDGALTNGMKALGAVAYNWTAGDYLNVSAPTLLLVRGTDTFGMIMTNLSGKAGYPADPMGRYYGPLNPTALSTAGDSTPDSQAIDPVAALALNVTVSKGYDPNCYFGGVNDALQVPDEEMSISQGLTYNNMGIQIPSGTTFYTGSLSPWSSSSCDYSTGSQYTYEYGSSGTSYLLPLNSQAQEWSVSLQLWVGNALIPQSAVATQTITGSPWQTWTSWASRSSDGFNVSIKVQALTRAPTILVNTSSDVASLTGYGYRYSGEQQFYSFELNMGSSSNLPSNDTDAMFQPGVNVILESRVAFSNSTAGEDGISSIDGLPGLSEANVTTQSGLGTNSSSSVSLSTWAADLSASSTNAYSANRTLQMLLPRNATGAWVPLAQWGWGAHKGWISLNSTQVELLGLASKALFLVPLTVPAWLATPSQAPPQSYVAELLKDAATVANDFVGALVALGNYIATVSAQLAAAVGQWIVGAFEAAASAVSAAVSYAESALNYWLTVIEDYCAGLVSAVLAPLKAAIDGYADALSAIELISLSDMYGGTWTVAKDLVGFWQNATSSVFLAILASGIAIMVILAIVAALSLGSGFVVDMLVSAVIGTIVATGAAVLLGKLLGSGASDATAPTRATLADVSTAANSTGFQGTQSGQGSYSSWIANQVFQDATASFIFIGDILSVVGGAGVIYSGLGPGSRVSPTRIVIGYTFSVASLFLDLAAQTHCNLGISVTAIVFGVIGMLYSFFWKAPPAGKEIFQTMQGVGTFAGIVGTIGAIGEVASSGC